MRMSPPFTLAFIAAYSKLEPGWTAKIELPSANPNPVRPWMTHLAFVLEVDTSDPKDRRRITVVHGFPIDLPEQTAYSASDWTEWIFDRIMDVHRHEAREFFTVGTQKVYPPEHGPDGDPYKDIPRQPVCIRCYGPVDRSSKSCKDGLCWNCATETGYFDA